MRVTPQLSKALPILLDQWVPTNAEVFNSLKQRISKSSKKDQSLLTELRKDPFLFCWLLNQNRYQKSSSTSLSDHLLLSLEKIREGKLSPQSMHQLRNSTEAQQRATRKAITRATASGILAPYFNVESDTAFAVSAFRELGIALIMWNYPRIYAQSLEWLNNQNDAKEVRARLFDERLTKMLGFSPFTLSLAIASELNLPNEVQIGLGQSVERIDISPEKVLLGSTLRKISEISDVFARATLPDAPPSAQNEWKNFRKELLPSLGAHGLKMLRETCNAVLEYYSDALPEVVAYPIPHSVSTPSSRSQTQMYLQNLHISHCTKEIQELFQQLYSQMNPHSVQYENIDFLMKTIVPRAGFTRGAIYLINLESVSLEPRMSVQEGEEPFTSVRYRDSYESEHIITRAFLAKAPVIEHRKGIEGLIFAGILGSIQRIGVLYLEAPHVDPHINRRICFKAVQQALSDCMNIS